MYDGIKPPGKSIVNVAFHIRRQDDKTVVIFDSFKENEIFPGHSYIEECSCFRFVRSGAHTVF